MNMLFIKSTEVTPQIVFDTENNIFEISGISQPENVRDFYNPILIWLDDYSKILIQEKGNKNIIFNFRFEYFNSSSAKFIMDIFKKIKLLHLNGIILFINWYYDEEDEDMLETGQEFSRILKVPFMYIKNII